MLIIIGKGPYEGELAAMVKRLGLERHVMFVVSGPSERAQMADMVAASDVWCCSASTKHIPSPSPKPFR